MLPIVLVAVLAGCSRGPGGRAAEPPGLQVFASIPPLASFTEAVGGERVRVQVLVTPGQDPHTYEPSPRQVASLARSRLLFLAGFPFEKALLPRLRQTMPQLEIVDTREGIDLLPDGEEAGGSDPHVWMSPRLARRQAENIRDALIRADPEGAEAYRAGFEGFAAELDGLHAELAGPWPPSPGGSCWSTIRPSATSPRSTA